MFEKAMQGMACVVALLAIIALAGFAWQVWFALIDRCLS